MVDKKHIEGRKKQQTDVEQLDTSNAQHFLNHIKLHCEHENQQLIRSSIVTTVASAMILTGALTGFFPLVVAGAAFSLSVFAYDVINGR